MTSLGKRPGPCAVAVGIAVALLGTATARGEARDMPSRDTPRISLPIRASQLPDPLSGRTTLQARTVHFPQAPLPPDYFGWLVTRTQIRYGRSMGDFYPLKGSGLRLVAGTRFYMTYGAYTTSPDARIAMQYDPRGRLGLPTLRDGYNGAPIALVGYGRQIGDRWTVGVDTGAMLGRTMTVYPYDDRGTGSTGPRLRPSTAINPLVDVTAALGF